MSSGGKRLNIALKERPVSADINRLQTLAAFGVAEILHSLLEGRATASTSGGGEDVSAPTMATRSTILSGLRCDPQAGVTDLLITPGVLIAGSIDASPDADDSDWKWVVDPGVTALGSLNLTPNGGGAVRIDIVECTLNDTLLESANREVWDEAAGQFAAPGPVQKVRARQLTYRIREGVVGAGFPGVVAGWLPLMVASVPAGALIWNTCTLWDVRPLAADLLTATGVSQGSERSIIRQEATSEPLPVPPVAPLTNLYLRGNVEARLGRYIAGGVLDDQTNGFIDVIDTANHDAAATPFVANRPWHLWAAFPFALPRWCRYTPALAPGSFRGIPLVSRKGPTSVLGAPFGLLTPPAALGLGGAGATSNVVMLCAGLVGAAANQIWGVEVLSGDAMTRHFSYGALTTIAPTSNTADTATFNLIDGTDVPASAKAVLLRITGSVTLMVNAGTTRRQIDQRDILDGFNLFYMDAGSIPHAAGDPSAMAEVFVVRLPYQSSRSSLGLKTREFTWSHYYTVQTGGTMASEAVAILGWEL
jgi:hypothetical protein